MALPAVVVHDNPFKIGWPAQSKILGADTGYPDYSGEAMPPPTFRGPTGLATVPQSGQTRAGPGVCCALPRRGSRGRGNGRRELRVLVIGECRSRLSGTVPDHTLSFFVHWPPGCGQPDSPAHPGRSTRVPPPSVSSETSRDRLVEDIADVSRWNI